VSFRGKADGLKWVYSMPETASYRVGVHPGMRRTGWMGLSTIAT